MNLRNMHACSAIHPLTRSDNVIHVFVDNCCVYMYTWPHPLQQCQHATSTHIQGLSVEHHPAIATVAEIVRVAVGA